MVYSSNLNKVKHTHGASSRIKENARQLRKNPTKQEKILWDYLRNRQILGKYFRRQHPYGIYILDFYCFESKLVIEVDGLIHLYNPEYDLERDEYLESSGLKVLRFNNDDIDYRIESVILKIKFILSEL